MLRSSRAFPLISFTVFLAVALGSSLHIPTILGWTTSPISFAAQKENYNRALSLYSSLKMSTTIEGNESASKVKVLGVCGGIGSGKSTACKLLVDSCNCLAHIDADKVAHTVYAPGSQAVQDVVNEFGEDILMGSSDEMEIDRRKLGAIVFAERSAMAKLEAIVWPHVKDMLLERINELKESWNQSGVSDTDTIPVVVLEAAILLDAGWDDLLDGVWAVTVRKEFALKRLVETRGLSEEEAQKRIDAQDSRRGIGSLEKEVESGTIQCVVSNNGSLDDLKESLQKSLNDPTCWKATP